MDLERFREVLNQNRGIILTHNNQRYKAKRITEVFYSSTSKDKCWQGHSSRIEVYIVRADKIFFVIEVYRLCSCYESGIETRSFESTSELEEYLNKNILFKDALENLDSLLNASSVSSFSSSSSEESY